MLRHKRWAANFAVIVRAKKNLVEKKQAVTRRLSKERAPVGIIAHKDPSSPEKLKPDVGTQRFQACTKSQRQSEELVCACSSASKERGSSGCTVLASAVKMKLKPCHESFCLVFLLNGESELRIGRRFIFHLQRARRRQGISHPGEAWIVTPQRWTARFVRSAYPVSACGRVSAQSQKRQQGFRKQ